MAENENKDPTPPDPAVEALRKRVADAKARRAQKEGKEDSSSEIEQLSKQADEQQKILDEMSSIASSDEDTESLRTKLKAVEEKLAAFRKSQEADKNAPPLVAKRYKEITKNLASNLAPEEIRPALVKEEEKEEKPPIVIHTGQQGQPVSPAPSKPERVFPQAPTPILNMPVPQRVPSIAPQPQHIPGVGNVPTPKHDPFGFYNLLRPTLGRGQPQDGSRPSVQQGSGHRPTVVTIPAGQVNTTVIPPEGHGRPTIIPASQVDSEKDDNKPNEITKPVAAATAPSETKGEKKVVEAVGTLVSTLKQTLFPFLTKTKKAKEESKPSTSATSTPSSVVSPAHTSTSTAPAEKSRQTQGQTQETLSKSIVQSIAQTVLEKAEEKLGATSPISRQEVPQAGMPVTAAPVNDNPTKQTTPQVIVKQEEAARETYPASKGTGTPIPITERQEIPQSVAGSVSAGPAASEKEKPVVVNEVEKSTPAARENQPAGKESVGQSISQPADKSSTVTGHNTPAAGSTTDKPAATSPPVAKVDVVHITEQEEKDFGLVRAKPVTQVTSPARQEIPQSVIGEITAGSLPVKKDGPATSPVSTPQSVTRENQPAGKSEAGQTANQPASKSGTSTGQNTPAATPAVVSGTNTPLPVAKVDVAHITEQEEKDFGLVRAKPVTQVTQQRQEIPQTGLEVTAAPKQDKTESPQPVQEDWRKQPPAVRSNQPTASSEGKEGATSPAVKTEQKTSPSQPVKPEARQEIPTTIDVHPAQQKKPPTKPTVAEKKETEIGSNQPASTRQPTTLRGSLTRLASAVGSLFGGVSPAVSSGGGGGGGVGNNPPTSPPDDPNGPSRPSMAGLGNRLNAFNNQSVGTRENNPVMSFSNRMSGMLGKVPGLMGGIGIMGAGAKQMLGSERAGDIGAGAFGMGAGVAATAGAMGVPSIQFVAPVMLFGKALMEGVEKLRRWGDELHNANMKFAEFSASMARVDAQSELRQSLLAQERGERRANSAGRLAEARDSLDKAFAPLEDAWANLKAEVLSPIMEYTASGLEVLNKLFSIASWFKNNKESDDDKQLEKLDSFNRLLEEIAKELRKGGNGRPPRFPAARG